MTIQKWLINLTSRSKVIVWKLHANESLNKKKSLAKCDVLEILWHGTKCPIFEICLPQQKLNSHPVVYEASPIQKPWQELPKYHLKLADECIDMCFVTAPLKFGIHSTCLPHCQHYTSIVARKIALRYCGLSCHALHVRLVRCYANLKLASLAQSIFSKQESLADVKVFDGWLC